MESFGREEGRGGGILKRARDLEGWGSELQTGYLLNMYSAVKRRDGARRGVELLHV